jgi:signal peptidase II
LGRRALTARRVPAAGLAIGVLLLNFAIEHFLVAARTPLVLVPGFLDYSPAWNRGVSFSLFSQDSHTGCLVLIAVLTSIVLLVGILAWRSATRLDAAGYGLVLGGALGNLADRSLSCAVFDYLFLHLGRISLFVFNFSDAAISLGALLLIANALLPSKVTIADS